MACGQALRDLKRAFPSITQQLLLSRAFGHDVYKSKYSKEKFDILSFRLKHLSEVKCLLCVCCSFAVQNRVGRSIIGYGIKNNLSPYVRTLIVKTEALITGIRGSPFEVL